MSPHTLNKINQLAARIAENLLATVQTALPNTTWKKAIFHDRRNFSKLRVELLDGTMNTGIRAPTSGEFYDVLDELRDMRESVSPKWHGLKLSIFPDGKCQLDFSYEENDPDFFVT